MGFSSAGSWAIEMEQRVRRIRDAEGARQAILAAAEEHFANHGFSGARIEAIAESSGYNKSMIFHYFIDKLGLYRAVVKYAKVDQEGHFAQTIMPLIENEETELTPALVRNILEEAVRYSFDRMLASPNLRRILAWEAAEGWQTFRLTDPSHAMQSRQRAITRFLQRAQALGILRAEIDPQLLMVYVLGLVFAHLISLPRYELLFPDEDFTSEQALERARTYLVQLVLHGTMQPFSEAIETHGV